MPQSKQALDATATAYWVNYFPDDYGAELTGNIPRRIAASIVKKHGAKATNFQQVRIAPMGYAKTPTGGLQFEGVFSANVKTGSKTRGVYRAFTATFSSTGRMELTSYPVSAPKQS